MYGEGGGEDIFYYITLYNENYTMPPKPEGVDEGILRGLYRFTGAPEGPSRRVTVLFSGSASQAALEAQQLLAAHHDVAAELWSATSYKALREEALEVDRYNRLHPSEPPRTPYVTGALSNAEGPIIAVTDYMKACLLYTSGTKSKSAHGATTLIASCAASRSIAVVASEKFKMVFSRRVSTAAELYCPACSYPPPFQYHMAWRQGEPAVQSRFPPLTFMIVLAPAGTSI